MFIPQSNVSFPATVHKNKLLYISRKEKLYIEKFFIEVYIQAI